MPTYQRWHQPGGRYFFTLVTHQRWPAFKHSNARAALRRAIRAVNNDLPFDMLAIVLLHDHLHCIWELPPGDDDYSTRWAQIKLRTPQGFISLGGRPPNALTASRQQKREAGFWQRRFWEHCIRDDDSYWQHRDYIHLNPVKHGYVERPTDWPWSSVHRHIASGMLDAGWPGSRVTVLPNVVDGEPE